VKLLGYYSFLKGNYKSIGELYASSQEIREVDLLVGNNGMSLLFSRPMLATSQIKAKKENF